MSEQQPSYTSVDVLGQAPDEPRRAPWALVGGIAALVLALVAGVTYGVGALSGGGSQPEEALPSGAFAFAKVDLDPSIGQKVDGLRFMRKFPALRERIGDRDDLRELAFEVLADGVPGWGAVDFDREVAPWLGDRIGVAAYPAAPASADAAFAGPTVLVAVQVTDADAARAGLARLADLALRDTADRPAPGFVVTGDYALLAPTQESAKRAAGDAERGVLSDDRHLAADLAAAGDGVVAAWLDSGKAVDSLGAAALGLGGLGGSLGGAGAASGRTTFVARFDGPDVFEVSGRATDTEEAGWATHPVRGVAELPESSVLALGLADGDELVRKLLARPAFGEVATGLEGQLGIEIPEDLAALVGDNLVAAVDGTESGNGSDTVQVGARVTTSEPARAERVLDRLAAAGGGELVLSRRRVGDDLVLASTPGQAERMAASGRLGDRSGFGEAMPDLDAADLAFWVDPVGLEAAFFGGGDPDPNLAPIQGVGATVTSGEAGSATFRIRLVAN